MTDAALDVVVLPTRAPATGVAAELGFDHEIGSVEAAIATWVEHVDPEMRTLFEWQFAGGSKYYRPLTLFGCYRANHAGSIPPPIIKVAMVVELFHNMTLIVDDILDESKYRRNRQTLHERFGNLPALMASGYMVAEGFRIVEEDAYAVRLFSELLARLGVAECLQWRLRRQPLDVQDWRRIAGEDTGSMFEVCACLGDRSQRLRRFGHLLGVLYHGCDDVGDVRGAKALGGGGHEDIRDGILTLPAALAIRNPQVARMFREPGEDDLEHLAQAFEARLPEAEGHLDEIAAEANREAELFAANPGPLHTLVSLTRQLSSR
jgi:geranylgeranyl pyrophosphate synthase